MQLRRLTLAVLLSAVIANAGVFMKQTITDLDHGKTATSEVSLDATHIKVVTTGSDHDSTFIYAGDRFYIINTADGTYRTFTREQLEKMFNQASQMTSMLEEKLKDMPPQQREMVERMMKQRMGAMSQPQVEKTVYSKVGSGSVGEWTCEKYEGRRGSEKVEEVCTVNPSALGLQASDFQVFHDLADMFQGFSQRMNLDLYRIGSMTPAEGEYTGVPVEQVSYRKGKAQQRRQVTEVDHRDFSDQDFAVPSGLKELETPMMGGR